MTDYDSATVQNGDTFDADNANIKGTLNVLSGGQAQLIPSGLSGDDGSTVTAALVQIQKGGLFVGQRVVLSPVANNGLIVATVEDEQSEPLEITGNVSGDGSMEIGNAFPESFLYSEGAHLQLDEASNNSVLFDDKHGTLILRQPEIFSGTITPFGVDDPIVLPTVNFSSVTGVSYAGTPSGGTLTVDQNGTSFGLKFAGSFYAVNFGVTNNIGDPKGSTVISLNNVQQVADTTGNAEAIARIYLAAFGRPPDLDGLQSYTAQVDGGTLSLAQVAATAPSSYEFQARYGSLSNADFVTQLYKNADGRTPDPGGLAAYTNTLDAGTSRGAVLLDIAESGEARLHAVAAGDAGDANDTTVYRLYEAVDGRAPDSAGQIAYSGALASGQSVQQIAGDMLDSQEFEGKYGTPDNTTFVTNLYHNLLGRAPDTPGLNSYVNDLAGGESRSSLVASFSSSSEARSVTAYPTHDGFVSVTTL